MKKTHVIVAALVAVAPLGRSMAAEPVDSIRLNSLNEIVVSAVQAPANAPFAVSRIGRKELETFAASGRELPFLLSRTPGVLAWSENGLGTGTTYLRIRGAADSRINVTLDGVALNSPEDQCVFWANTNSYAALLGSVQIQRGVGTSTNGDGAFGGTVSLLTKAPSTTPTLSLTTSGGSYNTWNFGGSASSGLLFRHLILDAAYHGTRTDGYIHGTQGASGSYYAGLTYVNTDQTLKLSYKNIGNYERTGQAWNGVTAGNDDYSLNVSEGIRTYRDMYKAGYGRYNSLYEHFEHDWDTGENSVSRYTMNDGSLWPRTTDNFWQNHNLLNLTWRISDHWTTTGTAHYTCGHGYYEEFRYRNKGYSKFGLYPFYADGSEAKKDNFVRKKGMTQDTYGLVWNARYTDARWDVIGGLSLQQFEANHYGYLTYTSNDLLLTTGQENLADVIARDGRYQYYDSDADKTDAQIFIKGLYNITSRLSAFADLQYRHVSYLTNGTHDTFVKQADGTYLPHLLNIAQQYDFLNPKLGLSYHHGGHAAYLSYALSHREPERNNFTDNGNYPAPKAESLHDVELGYNYTAPRWHAGLGLYAMNYHNQFVQTGMVSDIGENLTTNVRRSYRLGLELTAGAVLTSWLSLEANAAISKNAIRDFDEYVEDWSTDYAVYHYDNSTLAFSPAVILNGFADFHYRGLEATWHTNFVSRQYLDNTANRDRSLPKYTQTDIRLGYTLKVSDRGLKNIRFGLDLNNIFNRHYAASAWVYSAIDGETYTNANRYYQIGYIPMAGFTAMGNVTLNF